MNSRVGFAAGSCMALLASVWSSDAAAYCRMTTEGGAQVGNAACVEMGEPLEWKNPCLSYAIDSRGSRWMTNSDVEAAIDLAFETWENVDCGGEPPDLIFKPLQSSTCKRAEYNCAGNVNTIAFLDPWRDECASPEDPGYPPSAFAVTIVWHDTSTGEILDADMMINDTEATLTAAGGPYENCPDTGCPVGSRFAPGPADLRSIVTHEAGHFIGIGHSEVEEATMFASAERAEVSKRTLEQDDIDAVCDIYPPGSLDQSCNATPMGGLELDCEQKACADEACATGNGGGCNAVRSGADAPWASLLAGLVALMVWRRRRVARS